MDTTSPPLPAQRRDQRGLTLVELCVAVALIAILATMAAPSVQDVFDRHRLESAASQLATDIQFTRVEAVARNESVRISVHALGDGSCYVIHTGTADQCNCESAAAARPATCIGGAREIKTVRLLGAHGVVLQGVPSMQFFPAHGTVTPTGTLHVIGPKGRAIDHVVNVLGKVRSCSPGATMPGYKVCSS